MRPAAAEPNEVGTFPSQAASLTANRPRSPYAALRECDLWLYQTQPVLRASPGTLTNLRRAVTRHDKRDAFSRLRLD